MLPLGRALDLLGAAHPGPSAAVTSFAAAFAVSTGSGPARVLLVAAAVLAGQLSIGWGNDLVDVRRDRIVGRQDKPLVSGELGTRAVAVACGVAVVATVVFSLACGVVAGAVHLACVAAGWAYNLGLKATVVSWLPFALAFGGLPVFVALAEPGGTSPPWWVVLAAALLGVGAHLLNVLPDLVDDEATGVRGLAHRIGPRPTSVLAVTSLAAATVVVTLGAGEAPVIVRAAVLAAVAVLVAVALLARGRAPFRAAMGIAAVVVVLLVVAR